MLCAAVAARIAPAAFWRLSLKEWRALTATASDVLTRNAFDALRARYPDKP